MPKKPTGIIVVGATSGMIQPLLRKFARMGSRFTLAGRDLPRLQLVKDDLLSHHAPEVHVVRHAFDDFSDQHCWQKLWSELSQEDSTATLLILAQGSMDSSAPESAGEAYGQLVKAVSVNFLSVAGLADAAARYFSLKGFGQIVAVSSVAGDRGRPSNYIYGSSKAALSAWLQGLRAKYASKNVHIMTVKPGMTRTPMTSGMKDSLLFSGPEIVSESIYRGWKQGRNTVYAPAFWFVIMFIIRMIPESVFKRLRL